MIYESSIRARRCSVAASTCIVRVSAYQATTSSKSGPLSRGHPLHSSQRAKSSFSTAWLLCSMTAVKGVCSVFEVAFILAPYSSSSSACVAMLPRATCKRCAVPSTPHASMLALKSSSVFSSVGFVALRAAQSKGEPNFTPFGSIGSGRAPASSSDRTHIVWF